MGGRGAMSASASGIPTSNVADYKGHKEKNPFFGEVAKVSNKYFFFDQVKDTNSCIVVTNNLTAIKGNPVMITGKNTAIYLKDWQFKRLESRDGTEAYAVKLNKNYFKEYTFKSDFDFGGEKDTFDSLYKVAISQHKAKRGWKDGGKTVSSGSTIKAYKDL